MNLNYIDSVTLWSPASSNSSQKFRRFFLFHLIWYLKLSTRAWTLFVFVDWYLYSMVCTECHWHLCNYPIRIFIFYFFRMFIKTKSFNMAGTRANKRNFNIIPRTDVTHLSPLYLGKKRKHKQKREKQKYVWGVLIHLFAIITCWLSRRTNRKPSHVTALW